MADEQKTMWADSERYSRQMRFAPIGLSGQMRLLAARVLIVGCGALGSSLAQHMARAGAGFIRIADRDIVELSNLQRQSLFDEADAAAALPKAIAAAERLRRINSRIAIEPLTVDVDAASAALLARDVDIVLDGTDNAATRLLLSDVCCELGIPLVYGGVAGATAMSAIFIPGAMACLRCVVGGEGDGRGDASCDLIGVLGAAVEFAAALQTVEAMKYLTGNHSETRGTLVYADLWSFHMKEMRLPPPSAHCPRCAAGLRANAGQTPRLERTSSEEQRPESERKSPEERGPQSERESPEERTPAAGGVGEDVVTAPNVEEPIDGRMEEAADVPQSIVLCGRNTVQVTWASRLHLGRLERHLLGESFQLTVNRYLLKATMPDGIGFAAFPDGRVLVQGTADPAAALAVCRRYLPLPEVCGYAPDGVSQNGGSLQAATSGNKRQQAATSGNKRRQALLVVSGNDQSGVDVDARME